MLDVGSGVTFFPLYLRQSLGVGVECLDVDPTYPDRMQRFCELLNVEPLIPFHVDDVTNDLHLGDRLFDVVTSISVLEHLPADTWEAVVGRLWRLVRPGGRLILTFDVTLGTGGEGLPLSLVESFLAALRRVVGALPAPDMPPPRRLLTPQRPGYRFAPVRVDEDLVRARRLQSWVMDLRARPLPLFEPLACLLLTASKPTQGGSAS